MTNYSGAFIILMLFLASLAEAAPGALTYQGRIIKSDGTPLEYNSVSFSFEITSPDGLCILYREQVDGVNMVNSSGVFDVPIGEGVKSFPAGPTFGLLDAFANSGALACDGSANFTPAFDDGRKLRVKFHDGSGWKTVSPDSQIRSVPYAGYARSAAKLGANVAADFLLKTGIPTCAAGTYLSWDGTALSCTTPAGGGGGSGTVTNVTSANNYLTVTNGASTPLLTLNIGTGANTVAAGNDARFTDSRTPNGTASGDLSGTYPSPEVAKIQGNAVATGTIPGADVGKVYRWNGTNLASAFLNFGDLRTVTGAQQLAAVCAANEKIQWSVITDAFTCQAIGSLNASAITAGTIDTARLPASASYWQDGGSSKIYYSAGNVGIGVAAPNTALDLNGAFSMKGIAAPAVSPAGEGRIYFDSTDKKFKSSVDAGAYTDLSSPSFPLTGSFGTAGAPTYSFATDADTGMYRPNADQLAFSTGGTQRLRIQDNSFYSGSMGSSTSASPPSFRFDSLYSGAGSLSSSGRFIVDVSHSLSNTGNVTAPALGVTHTFSGANLTGAVSVSGGTSSYFRISNTAGYPGTGYGTLGGITTQAGAGAITGPQIGSWGLIELGAGASLPTLTLASAVKGEVKLAGTAAGGSTITTANGLEAAISTATNDVVTNWNGLIVRAPTGTGTVTNKNAIVTEAAAGNVGIGTTTPYSPLHVMASANGALLLQKVSNDNNAADFYSYKSRGTVGALAAVQADDRLMGLYGLGSYSATQFSANVGAIQILAKENFTNTAQGTYINFGTTPVGSTTRQTRMTIDADGNVGIGTTAPATTLSVAGTVSANQVSTALFQLGGPLIAAGSVAAWPNFTVQNEATDGYSGTLFLDSSGTNQGGMGYANSGAGFHPGSLFMTTFTAAPIIFGTNGGIERVRINQAGNMGVGNNNPTYKLDVTGDIAASGCLRSSAGVASGICTSDARLKTEISSFDLGLDALLGITPHFFKYNGLGAQPASEKLELGVIAQEVEKTAPELIITKKAKLHPDDSQSTEIKQVNYTAFTYVLINSVKELYNKFLGISSHQVDQDRQIASLEEENQKLKQQLEKQQKELELIKSKLGM